MGISIDHTSTVKQYSCMAKLNYGTYKVSGLESRPKDNNTIDTLNWNVHWSNELSELNMFSAVA